MYRIIPSGLPLISKSQKERKRSTVQEIVFEEMLAQITPNLVKDGDLQSKET